MEEFVEGLKKDEYAFASFWEQLEVKLSDDIDATRHFLNKDLKTDEAISKLQNLNENPNTGEKDVGQRQNEPNTSTGIENIPMGRIEGTGDRPKKCSHRGDGYAQLPS